MTDLKVQTISKNILSAMGEMTVKELAEKSGIVYSTLLPIIKGERDFGITKLLKIAEALNIGIEELLNGTYVVSNEKISTLPAKARYLATFITNNRSTRCCILDTEKNTSTSTQSGTKKTGYLLLPTYCTNSPQNTIDAFKRYIKQLLNTDNQNFAEVAVYATALSCEHVTGKEKLINIGKRSFGVFILEPDWMATYKTLYPKENGILITINDGYAISYSTNHGKTINKHQGYSFPMSDEAGATWLGYQAVRHAINVAEGVEKQSRLSDHILGLYNSDLNLLATTVYDDARDTCAEMANIVKALAVKKEKSYELIVQSFNNIWEHIQVLDKRIGKSLPIKLSGEMADIYEDFIPKRRFAGSNRKHETEEFEYGFNTLKTKLAQQA